MGDLVPGPRALIRYLASLRAFLAIVVVLFLLSAAVGYAIPLYAPGSAKTLLAGLQAKAAALSGQPPLVMMLGIFANNAGASLLAMLFGLAAGLFPLFFVLTNGLVIGIVLETMIAKLGTSGGVAVFLLGILPHGVLELPAVLVSTAIGLKLGYVVLLSIVKSRGNAIKELINNVAGELLIALPIFLFWIVPTLFLAAIIETYVTGALLAHFVQAPLFK